MNGAQRSWNSSVFHRIRFDVNHLFPELTGGYVSIRFRPSGLSEESEDED